MKNNQHIVFLTWKDTKHHHSGGAEQVIHEYATRLVKRGFRVTQLASGSPGLPKKEVVDGVEIERIATNHTIWLFAWHWFRTFKKNNSISAVIDEAGGWPMLSPLYTQGFNTQFFVHHVGDEEFDAFPWPLGAIAKKLYLWMFQQYTKTKTITVSGSTKSDLIKKFSYLPENISVIENVVEIPAQFSHIDEKSPLLPVVFLGRLTNIKRVEDAIKAFILASSNIPEEVELLIYGPKQDEKYYDFIQQLILESGLGNRIRFMGKVNPAQREIAMKGAKVMVVPSKKEGFGLVVLEANAYGVPVIGYDVAGLRDSIRNGENGIICKDGDCQEIANSIIRCYSDNDWYNSLVASTQKDYTSRPNWDTQTTNLIQVLGL